MSLSRTIKRLALEIRREAKANPAFAARLESVLAAHRAFGESDYVSAPEPPEEAPMPVEVFSGELGGAGAPGAAVPAALSAAALGENPLSLNPVAMFLREGEEGLRGALARAAGDEAGLRALVDEHNLDPAGEAAALAPHELVAHIVEQARRRVERDRKMFDY